MQIFAHALTILAVAGSASGDLPVLNLEQQAAMRCGTAFAIVTALQERGGANEISPLGDRGSEFFVRSMAKLMDETGATREQVQELVQREARELENPDKLEAVMPACLAMLDASGL